jgi:hypothetical protein
MREISFNVGGEVKQSGLLNKGGDIEKVANQIFADIKDDIEKWVTVSGADIETISDDTTVYAKTKLETINALPFVYDGVARDIVVVPTIPSNNYTYQWYLEGVAIDGANEAKYPVTNVSQSGKYQVKVTDTLTGVTVESNDVEVKISPAEIEVTNVHVEADFTYDGETHTADLKFDYPNDKGVTVTAQYLEGSENSGINVRKDNELYTIKLDKFVTDSLNYKAVYSGSKEFTWNITPKTVELTNIVWTDYSSFVFGVAPYEYEVTVEDFTVEGLAKDKVEVVRGGEHDKIEAGTYTATATFESLDPNYTIPADFVSTYEWSIAKQTIDVSTFSWTTDTTFTYDGNAHSVALNPTGQEKIITTTLGGTYTATNAGEYTATVTVSIISGNENNYEVTGTVADLTWKIEKAAFDVSGYAWATTTTFVYDGQTHTVTLANASDKLTVTYTNNTISTPGTKTAAVASVTFKSETDAANYTITGLDTLKAKTQTITMAKATIDVSGYNWNVSQDYKVTYDGTPKTVSLVGVNSLLTPVYQDNEKTEVGKYSARVTGFTFKDQKNADLYTVVGTGSIEVLSWSIVEPEPEEEQTRVFTYEQLGITIKNNTSVLFGSARLAVSDVSESVKDVDFKSALGSGYTATLLKCFDISIDNNVSSVDQVVDESVGTFTISITIPEEYRSKTNLKVFYISDDNSYIEDMNAVREGDVMTFETSHFSKYALVDVTEASIITPAPIANNSLIPGVVVLVAILLTLIILASVIIIYRWEKTYVF